MNITYNGYSGDERVIGMIKRTGLPVVVGGEGSVACAVEKKLVENGISNYEKVSIDAVKNTVMPRSRIPFDRFIFLCGYLGCYRYPHGLFDTLKGCMGGYSLSEVYETERFSHQYYLEHQEDFEASYNLMEDELSRKSMEAYITSRVNESADGLHKYVRKPQYFGVEFFKPFVEEYCIDCGAFDGDTLRDFVKWTNGSYGGYIALEPNKGNANNLRRYIRQNGIENIVVIEKCAYSEKTTMHFRINAENSRIAEEGDIVERVEADTIDNISGDEHVTFIKMDIEGAELSALKGAKRTIGEKHPILAISAYHKQSDLLELPKFIRDCHKGYRFYFRLHKELPIDAILYAVPENRMI